MLVYAVYAIFENKLYRRDVIYETFVMKYIAFPFCFFLDCSSLDAWASLAFSKNFAIRDGELTPSRQNKGTSFFVLPSIFRNFVRICRISLDKGSLGD